VLADEVVVVEMRIRGMDAGDFVALAWAERLVGIEAPNTFEQALGGGRTSCRPAMQPEKLLAASNKAALESVTFDHFCEEVLAERRSRIARRRDN